jgi:hypothetical protein
MVTLKKPFLSWAPKSRRIVVIGMNRVRMKPEKSASLCLLVKMLTWIELPSTLFLKILIEYHYTDKRQMNYNLLI